MLRFCSHVIFFVTIVNVLTMLIYFTHFSPHWLSRFLLGVSVGTQFSGIFNLSLAASVIVCILRQGVELL